MTQRCSAAALTTALLSLFIGNPAAAQTTYSWNGSINSSWATPGNWSPNGPAVGSNLFVNTADFSQLTLPSAGSVVLNGNQSIGNLIFGDKDNQFGWTISDPGSSTLTLLSSAIPSINVVNESATIAVILAGTQGFTMSSTSGKTLTLSGLGNGSIVNNIGTGAGSVVLNGAGTWIFSGNNTYSGGVVDSRPGRPFRHDSGPARFFLFETRPSCQRDRSGDYLLSDKPAR